MSKIDKSKFILYVLNSVEDKTLSPIQIQKLLFLIDKKLSEKLGGDVFSFKPYDYGPFDKEIYNQLELLIEKGLVETVFVDRIECYKLSNKYSPVSLDLDSKTSEGIKKLAQFVKSCSFRELLVTIYNDFPEMAINTVFKGWRKGA